MLAIEMTGLLRDIVAEVKGWLALNRYFSWSRLRGAGGFWQPLLNWILASAASHPGWVNLISRFFPGANTILQRILRSSGWIRYVAAIIIGTVGSPLTIRATQLFQQIEAAAQRMGQVLDVEQVIF